MPREVLVQELEQLCSGVLVQSVRELGDGRRDLETLAEDDLLALKADIFGPLHEAGEILLRLNVLTYRHQWTFDDRQRKNKSMCHSPIPKFLGRDSKRGFFWVFDALPAP